MGEIMKKAINKILNVDKKTFVFLSIISIIGIVTGSLYMIILTSKDKLVIHDSLNDFINNIDKMVFVDALKNNIIINMLYLFVIWFLGISIICLPIVIFLIFIKSFIISFSFTSFIVNYKTKGILYAFIYNFPHNIINIIVYIYVGTFSLRLSLALLNSIIYKKNINFKNVMNKYLKVLILSLIVIILTTLYESFVMPIAFKKLLTMI